MKLKKGDEVYVLPYTPFENCEGTDCVDRKRRYCPFSGEPGVITHVDMSRRFFYTIRTRLGHCEFRGIHLIHKRNKHLLEKTRRLRSLLV